jgi:hypothetical protein
MRVGFVSWLWNCDMRQLTGKDKVSEIAACGRGIVASQQGGISHRCRRVFCPDFGNMKKRDGRELVSCSFRSVVVRLKTVC